MSNKNNSSIFMMEKGGNAMQKLPKNSLIKHNNQQLLTP